MNGTPPWVHMGNNKPFKAIVSLQRQWEETHLEPHHREFLKRDAPPPQGGDSQHLFSSHSSQPVSKPGKAGWTEKGIGGLKKGVKNSQF